MTSSLSGGTVLASATKSNPPNGDRGCAARTAPRDTSRSGRRAIVVFAPIPIIDPHAVRVRTLQLEVRLGWSLQFHLGSVYDCSFGCLRGAGSARCGERRSRWRGRRWWIRRIEPEGVKVLAATLQCRSGASTAATTPRWWGGAAVGRPAHPFRASSSLSRGGLEARCAPAPSPAGPLPCPRAPTPPPQFRPARAPCKPHLGESFRARGEVLDEDHRARRA